MLTEIAEIFHRSRATALEDAVGVLSLFVMLYAGLVPKGYAPGSPCPPPMKDALLAAVP